MKDGSIQVMDLLLSSSITLPQLVQAREQSSHPPNPSPYLQQVGRKWETKKQRQMKKKRESFTSLA